MSREKYIKPYRVEGLFGINSHILEYKHRERKTDRFLFFRGEYVEPQEFDLIFHAVTTQEKILQYDCPPNNAGVILANKRILDILNEICPDDFQAFDVLIVNDEEVQEGFEIKGYKLINIIKRVDSFDKEKSVFDFYADDLIMGVKKRIFNLVECMGDVHLARDQTLKSHILASPTLKKACEKAKIKGLKFLKDDSV